ncbi:MAG: hypothetical protein IJP09_00135 [Clostridia bacterium]|nr:hypothetical protein [Clostridia bacterium]
MKRKEYTVKQRYCPSRGENIIVRVSASVNHEEICLSCHGKNLCKECVLGLRMEEFKE